MSTTYTPTAAPLPATLTLPQNAVEQVIVETVNTNTAILADAILQNEEDIDSTQTDLDTAEATIERIRFAKVYQSQLLGTTLAFGDYLEINNSDNNKGFSTFSIGGGGTELQFPTYSSNNLRGIYDVQIDIRCTVDSTDAVTTGAVQIYVYDPSGPTETAVGPPIQGWRYTADDAAPLMIHGGTLVDMTGLSPGLSRLRIKWAATPSGTLSATNSRIRVTRAGDGTP